MEITFSVELTDLCNARCNYCIIGTGQAPHGTRLGYLSLEDFHRLFERFDEFLADAACTPAEHPEVYLRLCGIGEPTLHRDFLEFFEIAMAQPHIRQLALVTNGSYLPKERVDAMAEVIRRHPEVTVEVLLGLDAVDTRAQRAIKKVSNIWKVNSDVEYFLGLKRRHGLDNLKFVLQLVVTDENLDQVIPFCRFWSHALQERDFSFTLTGDWGYLDHIQDYDAFIWIKCRDAGPAEQPRFDELHRYALAQMGIPQAGNKPSALPQTVQQRHSETNSLSNSIKICGVFWYGINVNAAGDISPCCIDNAFELKIGNIREAPLPEIYRGEIMRRMRLAHIQGDFSEVPLCAACTSVHRYKYVSREAVERYLSAVGEELSVP
ncbi:MAG: SPASM domain-containing protein [Candidatus Omnitrophica bacterium]|nr:SPASM domain-containing protein [Candidatus Omnitrophota bacterium]